MDTELFFTLCITSECQVGLSLVHLTIRYSCCCCIRRCLFGCLAPQFSIPFHPMYSLSWHSTFTAFSLHRHHHHHHHHHHRHHLRLCSSCFFFITILSI